jgi:signal transduction histidine kinase
MKVRRLGPRLMHRWRSLPPRTIRLRLTAVYGGLFILCGAALLGITYGLVASQYSSAYVIAKGTQASGVAIIYHTSTSIGGGSQSGVTAVGPQGGQRIGSPEIAVPSQQVLQSFGAGVSTAARGTLLIESGIALAIMSLIAIWLGWIVAGRTLSPLRAITAAAREISASNLHRRLALSGPDDELRQLGNTFDGLLERLEKAFAAQRQFAANVSHELRTPLTFERTLIEVALADPDASVESLRGVCEQVLAAGEQQERLIDALLVLSRGQRGLERHEPVDLEALAAEALASLERHGLTVEPTLEPAMTVGDPRLVERLVANLLANAVAHNRPGGRVTVATRTADGRAIIAVANSGPVIPPEAADRLFEPFQRLNGARIGGVGLGLGLSIVKAIADAHGATIATTLPTEGGLEIEVSFPARSGPPISADGAGEHAGDADTAAGAASGRVE